MYTVVALIIAAIAAAAATGISAGVQSSESEKSRKEARGLAEIRRGDELKQAAVENKRNEGIMRLGRERLGHADYQLATKQQDYDYQMDKAEKDYRQKSVTGLADSIGDDEVSRLFNENRVRRWGV